MRPRRPGGSAQEIDPLPQEYEVPVITGYALLPFVISIIYSVTHCGNVKLPWWKDILALAVAVGAYAGTQQALYVIIANGVPAFFVVT